MFEFSVEFMEDGAERGCGHMSGSCDLSASTFVASIDVQGRRYRYPATICHLHLIQL